jgi:hypothetical protein
MKLAAEQGEQARLSAAIGADEADPPAGVDLQVRVLDEDARTAGEGELPELDHGLGRTGGRKRRAFYRLGARTAVAMRAAPESGTIRSLPPGARRGPGDP